MISLANEISYPIFALLMLLLVLVFIPRQEIKKLFWFSLLWGSAVDLFLILLLTQFFHLYQYEKTRPFDFYGSPIWINLAWSPAIMIFIYFLPKRKEWYVFPFYLSGFAMVSVFIGMFFTQVGLITEIHWNELLRFPVSVLWFYGAAWHYNQLKDRDKTII